jgi:uncharacterized protein YxjI
MKSRSNKILTDPIIKNSYFSISSSLIKIEQELFHVRPTYKIQSVLANGTSDRLLAVVKKNFRFLQNEFTIYSIYGPYSLKDLDIVAHSFILTKDGQTVAVINKKSVSMSDTYDVEITSDQNQVFIFALVIVIDRCLFNKDKHDHHN